MTPNKITVPDSLEINSTSEPIQVSENSRKIQIYKTLKANKFCIAVISDSGRKSSIPRNIPKRLCCRVLKKKNPIIVIKRKKFISTHHPVNKTSGIKIEEIIIFILKKKRVCH